MDNYVQNLQKQGKSRHFFFSLVVNCSVAVIIRVQRAMQTLKKSHSANQSRHPGIAEPNSSSNGVIWPILQPLVQRQPRRFQLI